MTRRTPIVCLAAAIAGYFALWLLAPRATFLPAIVNIITLALPLVDGWAADVLRLAALFIMTAPTVAFMAIQFSIVYYFAQTRMSFPQSLVALVVSLAGVAALIALIVWQSGVPAKIGHWPSLKMVFSIVGFVQYPLKMPMYVLIMLAAATIGYMVSLRVMDRNLLLPVVMFAAWIDFWTVTRGPVYSMMRHAPELIKVVAAPIPKVGTGAFVPDTLIGPGDFLFAGLVFAAVYRLGMNSARNFWFILTAMTLGMLAVSVGLIPYLPALIALAVAVVAANWREFRLTRQEAVSMAVVGLVLLAALPLIWSILSPRKVRAPAGKPGHRTTDQRPARTRD